MSKPQLNAKEILQDIRAGLDDTALMEKYGLSRDGLHSAYDKLVRAGLITRATLCNSAKPRSKAQRAAVYNSGRTTESDQGRKRLPRSVKIALWAISVLVLIVICGISREVLKLWSAEYVPLGEGIHVVTENTPITDRIDDYDRLTRFIDQDDNGAQGTRLRPPRSWPHNLTDSTISCPIFRGYAYPVSPVLRLTSLIFGVSNAYVFSSLAYLAGPGAKHAWKAVASLVED